MKKISLLVIAISFVITACDSEEAKSPSKMIEKAKQAVQAVEEKATEVVDAVESQSENLAAVEETVEKAKEVVQETVAKVEAVTAVSGEAVYKKSCVSCHGTGAANAPKLADTAAWAPRIEKGMDALYASALNGVPGTAMMAKGTCGSCSEEELQAAVDYMVEQSK